MIAFPLKAIAPNTASASPGTSAGSGVLLNGSLPCSSSAEFGMEAQTRTAQSKSAGAATSRTRRYRSNTRVCRRRSDHHTASATTGMASAAVRSALQGQPMSCAPLAR